AFLGMSLANQVGDSEGALKRCRAGLAAAEAIGAHGWANMLLADRIAWAWLDGDPDTLIEESRDLLARMRPTLMFNGMSRPTATWSLVGLLAERNAQGDLEEALALARESEKFDGRQLGPRDISCLISLALSGDRPA